MSPDSRKSPKAALSSGPWRVPRPCPEASPGERVGPMASQCGLKGRRLEAMGGALGRLPGARREATAAEGQHRTPSPAVHLAVSPLFSSAPASPTCWFLFLDPVAKAS